MIVFSKNDDLVCELENALLCCSSIVCLIKQIPGQPGECEDPVDSPHIEARTCDG